MAEFAWIALQSPTSRRSRRGSIPPDGQNYYRYENEEVTNLRDRTIDETPGELVQQATDIMADVPLIPLYQRPEIYTFSESLRG